MVPEMHQNLKKKKKGFVQCISDPCVFIRDNSAIIGVYVDNLIILVPKRQHDMMRGIKKNLKAEFKIKELKNVQKILNIRVTKDRKRRTVYLNQTQYIRKFLHEFHITEPISKPVRTPVNGNSAFRKIRVTNQLADQKDYQRRIGSIMFAIVYSRPNIYLMLSKLSQYMNDPGEYYACAVKHIFRYLRSNSEFRIQYNLSSDGKIFVVRYSNSNYTDDVNTRRFTLRFTFLLGKDAISWVNRKQRSVSTFIMKTEYITLCQATKHAI
jgi:hypothetical protein